MVSSYAPQEKSSDADFQATAARPPRRNLTHPTISQRPPTAASILQTRTTFGSAGWDRMGSLPPWQGLALAVVGATVALLPERSFAYPGGWRWPPMAAYTLQTAKT